MSSPFDDELISILALKASRPAAVVGGLKICHLVQLDDL